ncbi:type II secretion system protein N [Salipiger abyssi]|uniref:Type IV pilus biogenesis n=1 Tax=Salipiger abyssi TaxID=1250539 RepID=A0A1P8UXG0_9RHOB|nr:type II secretion system protein N [Salipiger abyssi]APZ54036.1 Type IV pilus biogenesis [Salipiger abyssi]
MRILATLCTLAALAAAGWSGVVLWQELDTRTAAAQPVPAGVILTEAAATAPPAPPRRWPALFGEPQPPAPPAPAEPTPPAAAKPPLESLGYRLNGVVRSGNKVWAIVSHPAGEQLVRGGDRLGEGILIDRIDTEGMWISRDGDTPELLAFPE